MTITKNKLKLYIPLAIVAGVGAYTLYAQVTERKNTQLADKPKKTKRYAGIKEWEASKKEKEEIGKLDSEVEIANSISERNKLLLDFYDVIRSGYVLSVTNTYTGKRILVNSRSKKETARHASLSKTSTKAVFHLKKILENAKPLDNQIYPAKTKGSQSRYRGVRLFYYDLDGVGLIKLVIGIRKGDDEHEQYCLTAIE